MTTELAQRHPRLAALFGIDLRTLALFRILLGTVITWNLCRIYPDLTAFYSDMGLTPRSWIIEADSSERMSLYFLNGSTWFVGLLLTVQVAFAAMFALGYRTRLATVVSFLMYGSLCNRNPLVLIGGDILICCLLFWAMFLPVAARWSLDARRAANPPPLHSQHLSWASLAVLLQVMSVYFFSAILKSDPEWMRDDTGVYYALQLDRYATPLGQWMLQFPLVLKWLSKFVWWLEMVGPLLIFTPLFLKPTRFVLMLLFMGMHTGFIFCLEIGHFPYVSISSLSLFLGGWFWDWLEQKKRIAPFSPGSGVNGGPQVEWEVGTRWQRLAAFFMVACMAWNLATIKVLPFGTFNDLSPLLRMLRIDQYWNMFAPSPLKADGWMVIPAKLADGTEIDLLHPERAPVYSKPYHYSQTHENIKWNTFRGRLYEQEFAAHRQYYAKYLCRSWNRDKMGDPDQRDKRLMSFKIIYMVEFTLPHYEQPNVKKVELWDHYCFPRSAPRPKGPVSETAPTPGL